LVTLKKQLSAVYQKSLPLLVKTSVDLPKEERESFAQTVVDQSIEGLVISNTTLDHQAVLENKYGREEGGLSGKPLRIPASRMNQEMHQFTQGKLPIIGVGGILSADDAKAHFQAGASLLQILTGFVYHGPDLLMKILL